MAKPFMYAIEDSDGSAWMDEGCVSEDRETLENEVLPHLNAELKPELRFRVVALYTRKPRRKRIAAVAIKST